MRSRIRFLGAAVVTLAAALTMAPASGGDTGAPVWTCRASVGYLDFPDQFRLEPLVANGGTSAGTIDRAQCVDDNSGFPEIVIGGEPGQPGSITIQGPFARTEIDPDLSVAFLQRAGSAAATSKVRIASSDGSFELTADIAEATGSGSCQGVVPAFSTTSRVVGVAVNGEQIPIDDALIQIGDGISDSGLGALLQLRFNREQIAIDPATGDRMHVRRAIDLQFYAGDGGTVGATPVFQAVVGESRVGHRGTVCAGPPPPPPRQNCPAGTVEVSRGPDGTVVCERSREACPEGYERDSTGNCLRVIFIHRPPEPPQPPCPDGQVRDIDGQCRPEPASRCTGRGFGNPMLGTNRRDRITGTNRRDRILSLGGSDRVSGGRGSDCLEGGSGGDNLDGSNNDDLVYGGTGRDIENGGTGDDRMYGDSGNDKITGGSGNDRMFGGGGRDRLSGGLGNDRLYGGAGKDYINTGNGRDVVRGGSGNDEINAATAGPPARIDCGPGHDVLRINGNETRRHRNCERVLVAVRR